MRIGIFDILLLMLLAALATVHFKGHRDLSNAHNELQVIEPELRDTLAGVHATRASLKFAEQRKDYADQVELAYRNAMNGFDKVRQRHGKVIPEPGKVVFRRVPEIAKQSDVTISRWRISIPTEYPVMLRSGSSKGDFADGELDKQDWSDSADLSDPQSYQKRLTPGIHDLCFARGREDSHFWFEIQLDDHPLVRTKFLFESNGYGSSSPGGLAQYQFDLDGKSQSLFTIDAKRDDSIEHRYAVWVSGSVDVAGFEAFPGILTEAKIDE